MAEVKRTESSAAHWALGELDSVRTWGEALVLVGDLNDFSSYATGTGVPTGWTSRLTAATWSIIEDSGLTGGKALRRVSGGSLANRAVSWDVLDGRDDVDLYARTRVNDINVSANMYSGIVARGSGSTCYACALSGSTSALSLRIFKCTSASAFSTLADSSSIGGGVTNQWYWIRFQLVGTTLRGKLWAGDPADEPEAWSVTVTDSSYSIGWAGVFGGRLSANYDTDVFFSYGPFESSGNRISPPLDVTAAGTYANSKVAWTATTPTDTTLTIDGFVTGETAIVAEAVGTGNGVATVFTLDNYPAVRLDDLVGKIDGTATTAYTRVGRTLTFDAAPGDTLAITADYTGVDWPINEQAEVQTLDLDGPTGGTFKLGDGTTWTADLAHDATPATIQTALEGLYGAGNVGVSGTAGLFTVTFPLSIGDSGLVADFTGLTYV